MNYIFFNNCRIVVLMIIVVFIGNGCRFCTKLKMFIYRAYDIFVIYYDIHTDIKIDICTDIYYDIHTDTKVDICTDIYYDIHTDTKVDICTDIYYDIHTDTIVDICSDIYYDIHTDTKVRKYFKVVFMEKTKQRCSGPLNTKYQGSL